MWMMLVVAPLAAPLQGERMESITGLGFHWPVGAACTVEQERRVDGASARASRSFEVRNHADGLAIHQTSVWAAAPLEELDLIAPVLVIKPDGHFRRVEGLEGYIKTLDERRAGAASLPEAQRAPLLARLDALSDARATQRRHMDAWERSIGLWSGLYVKETTSGSGVAGGPALGFPGSESFDWFYSFHIGGSVACAGEAGEPRCVELRYNARPWGKGMSTLATTAAAAFGVPGWSSTQAEITGVFTVEAATMLPVRLEERWMFRGEGSDGGARERRAEVSEAWSCVKPPASGS